MSSNILFPFQLLELNVISAQDLEPLARNMRTYAVAWVHPDRRLSTRVDASGHTNPTWNDKFVFRVDDEFLYTDTSAVMIEIYALHWFRDIHVGTVRILVGNLFPPPTRPHHPNHHLGMRFVALQVRRPSGRPQGILNIGVGLLDSSMRSMPLLRQFSTSAVGYSHLMGENPHHRHQNTNSSTTYTNNAQSVGKPELRRVKSDSTCSMISTNRQNIKTKKPVDSIIDGSEMSYEPKRKGKSKSKASSLISGSSSSDHTKTKTKKGKASSILSASEVENRTKNGKPRSIVNGVEVKPALKRTKSGKAGSLINTHRNQKPGSEVVDPPINHKATPLKQFSKFNMANFESSRKGGFLVTESDLGPSPSEVAAAVAARDTTKVADNESSILEGWSLDESVEGLESKLERWRSELPPVYDLGEFSSFPSGRHTRRHTDGSEGLFSCFSNIFGVECSIVCGGQSSSGKKKKRSGRVNMSLSEDNYSYV